MFCVLKVERVTNFGLTPPKKSAAKTLVMKSLHFALLDGQQCFPPSRRSAVVYSSLQWIFACRTSPPHWISWDIFCTTGKVGIGNLRRNSMRKPKSRIWPLMHIVHCSTYHWRGPQHPGQHLEDPVPWLRKSVPMAIWLRSSTYVEVDWKD